MIKDFGLAFGRGIVGKPRKPGKRSAPSRGRFLLVTRRYWGQRRRARSRGEPIRPGKRVEAGRDRAHARKPVCSAATGTAMSWYPAGAVDFWYFRWLRRR